MIGFQILLLESKAVYHKTEPSLEIHCRCVALSAGEDVLIELPDFKLDLSQRPVDLGQSCSEDFIVKFGILLEVFFCID